MNIRLVNVPFNNLEAAAAAAADGSEVASFSSLTLLLFLPFHRPLSLLNPLSYTFVAFVLLLSHHS